MLINYYLNDNINTKFKDFTSSLRIVWAGLMSIFLFFYYFSLSFLVRQDNIKTAKQEQFYYKRNSPYQQGEYQPPQAVGSKKQQN